MRRHALGIISVVLLILGVYFFVWPPSAAAQQWLHGSCIRIGLVMLAVWLAYPHLVRIPKWMVGGLLVGMAVVAVRPKLVVLVIPLLVAFWLLRPRTK